MPLQPKKVDNAHGASKLYNLPGFLDSDKTIQLLLGAIVLYSSLPSLPQQKNKTKNKKKQQQNNATPPRGNCLLQLSSESSSIDV